MLCSMNLHHLKVFLAVAEAGSISAGAEQLHISQPAVTREIRDLEASVGIQLFDRQTRGVSLTEAGERLRDYARRIFALEQAAERDLQTFVNIQHGELLIGASATLGTYWLPPLLSRFRQQHGHIFISLEVTNTQQVLEQLESGKIQLGFIEGECHDQRVAKQLLARDELLPVVAPQHPLAQKSEPISVHELQQYPLYLREQGSGARLSIETAYANAGLSAHAQMAIGSTEAIKHLLNDALGTAWLSQRVVENELKNGRLVRLNIADLHIERELHALWRGDMSLSPAPAAFLAMCAGA